MHQHGHSVPSHRHQEGRITMPAPKGNKFAVGADSGRPTDYKPEYAEQAKKLCQLGATDIEMADFFGVDVRTIYRWKHNHDEFCQSQATGKDIADERVERSLYQRAVGYEQDEIKIFMPAGADAPVYAPYRAKVAPDVSAAMFWLKNRRKDKWRDKQDVEHSGSVASEPAYDLSGMSDDELRAFRDLLAKAQRK